MRLQHYALAFATGCSITQTVAAPLDLPSSTAVLESAVRVSTEPVSELTSEWRDAGAINKYFHEPGDDNVLGHYDVRFFHGPVDYDERTDTLRHMMRAYLNFFREKDLETWIAHGTLLGWWWNSLVLPWDWDIDTQVSEETLAHMGKYLNRTLHTYNATSLTSPTETISRDYLLDVNPWSWERKRGDGMNIIDARWIDTRNGLYIDITGLSETDPDLHPNVWTCKNYHHYRTSDLYPMRDGFFEGVPAKIPYAYERILLEEYGENALLLTEYEGHEWNLDQQLWLKKS